MISPGKTQEYVKAITEHLDEVQRAMIAADGLNYFPRDIEDTRFSSHVAASPALLLKTLIHANKKAPRELGASYFMDKTNLSADQSVILDQSLDGSAAPTVRNQMNEKKAKIKNKYVKDGTPSDKRVKESDPSKPVVDKKNLRYFIKITDTVIPPTELRLMNIDDESIQIICELDK
jgi:hypothetical protein